jgi:hypothetical protein
MHRNMTDPRRRSPAKLAPIAIPTVLPTEFVDDPDEDLAATTGVELGVEVALVVAMSAEVVGARVLFAVFFAGGPAGFVALRTLHSKYSLTLSSLQETTHVADLTYLSITCTTPFEIM